MAKKENSWAMIGSWAFIAGLVIAVLAGIYSPVVGNAGVYTLLGILGLIVGILNITDKEVNTFLIATIAFMVAAGGLVDVFSFVPTIGGMIKTVLSNIVVFVAPGAGIVALRALYDVSREG